MQDVKSHWEKVRVGTFLDEKRNLPLRNFASLPERLFRHTLLGVSHSCWTAFFFVNNFINYIYTESNWVGLIENPIIIASTFKVPGVRQPCSSGDQGPPDAAAPHLGAGGEAGGGA